HAHAPCDVGLPRLIRSPRPAIERTEQPHRCEGEEDHEDPSVSAGCGSRAHELPTRLSADARQGAASRVRSPVTAAYEPLLESAHSIGPDAQSEARPPPENIFRGLRELHAAEVV